MVAVGALAFGLAPALVGTPTPAAAEPSISEVQDQLEQMRDDLETVTEQYNQATVDLSDKQDAADDAKAHAEDVQGQLEQVQGKVRQMASSVYRAAPFSQFTAFLVSDSPENFLGQLSGLDALATERGETLDDLSTAIDAATEAQATADDAEAAAQQIADDLNEQRAYLDDKIPEQEALLASLTEDQREEVLGPQLNFPPGVTAEGAAATAIAAARSVMGSSYQWGATGPNVFDCSGLTQWAYGQAGVSIPRTSAAQSGFGTPVSQSELRPGDLVFFYSPVHHVGLYIGDGLMIHAPTSGDVVKVSEIGQMPYTGARRVA